MTKRLLFRLLVIFSLIVEEWNHFYDAGDAVIPVAIGDVDNDGLNEFLVNVHGLAVADTDGDADSELVADFGTTGIRL